MRHFRSPGALSASFPVAPLALGVTVATVPAVLITPCGRAARLPAGDAGTTRPAVLLTAVTARADPHLALTPRTQKQPGIVHRVLPGEEGLDDPPLHSDTGHGAVRECGSGRSSGH
jgi:hypothetical protein